MEDVVEVLIGRCSISGHGSNDWHGNDDVVHDIWWCKCPDADGWDGYGSEVTNRVEVYLPLILLEIVGDFLWTLDPVIAATMIAAMVFGLVLTIFCVWRVSCHGARELKFFLNIFRTFNYEIQNHSKEAQRGICSKGRTSLRCKY